MHNNKIFFSIITIFILVMPVFSAEDINKTIENAYNEIFDDEKSLPIFPTPQNNENPNPTSKRCPILKEYECHDVKCCKEKYKEKKDYKECCINRVKKEQQTVKKEQPTVNKKSVKNVDINSKNIAKLSSKVKKMKDLCISIEEELQKLEKKPKPKSKQ